VDRCDENPLKLNAEKNKTKEDGSGLIITPVYIRWEDVDTVDSSKYLGMHLNNRVDWSNNVQNIGLYKKGLSRPFKNE